MSRKITDQALIDLWWTICEDEWAIPDELMIKFGRAAIELAEGKKPPKVSEVHVEDCDCSKCRKGGALPANKMTEHQWNRFVKGEIYNNTGQSDYLLVPIGIRLPAFAHALRGYWSAGMSDYPEVDYLRCTDHVSPLHEHGVDDHGFVYCCQREVKWKS